MAFYNHRESFR